MKKNYFPLIMIFFYLLSVLSAFTPISVLAAFPNLQICTNESGYLVFGSPNQKTLKMVDSTGIIFKEITLPPEVKQNSRFQICPCGGFVVVYDAIQGKFFYLNDTTEEIEESYPVSGIVTDVAVSKNRSRYVGIAKGSSAVVSLYDENRHFIRDLSLSSTIKEASLIQLDRDNKLWVYDKKNASIFRFDTKGSLLLTVKKFGSANIPELVSFDSDIHNMLYAMDREGTTYYINSRGENLTKIQWKRPGAGSMAYDAVHKQTFIATQSIFCGNSSKQKEWEIAKPWQTPMKKIFEMRIGSRIFMQYGSTVTTMDAAPYIDAFSNRTMVPLRNIAEAVGCQVNWIATEQKIELTKSGLKVVLVINQKTALVNNNKVQLDTVPTIKNSRTFVPLRFVGETFSFQVEWKEHERKIRLIG
jgi:hypothetical protein